MAQNQLTAQAVQSGAFGGARQGVQRAELERAILSQIGQAQAQGFDCIRCTNNNKDNNLLLANS